MSAFASSLKYWAGSREVDRRILCITHSLVRVINHNEGGDIAEGRDRWETEVLGLYGQVFLYVVRIAASAVILGAWS